jgi:hypothetical protein
MNYEMGHHCFGQTLMSAFSFFLLIVLSAPSFGTAQRIAVKGNQFHIDGKRI